MRLTYSIVIPTMNRRERIRRALETLVEQTRRPERVVVVDASTPPVELPDATRRLLADAEIDLVMFTAEPSTARQRNLGVDRVQSPLVLFLDDDVSIEPRYVEVLLERWEAAGLQSRGGMVGCPQFIPPQGTAARLVRCALMLHYHARRGESTRLRASGKLRFVARPRTDVEVPAVGSGGALFRRDLLLRHRFDERFPGYAPGEDIEMSCRLSRDAPIVQTPAVRFLHEWDPRERQSDARWHIRGRRETYFRLRHVARTPAARAALALSLLAETAAAAIDSLRERDIRHLRGFVSGVVATLREERSRPR